MSQQYHDSFDPTTVPLEGTNLVEASAGTGKTYSIAILALRLLLENEIPVNQILMVTYTNAAVAELEDRIRRFIRSAYRSIEKNQQLDNDIQSVIDTAIEKKGKEKITRLLKSAVNSLDETIIMTIHGFCQKTLTEFAFETNQIFDSKLVTTAGNILEDETNQFWRRYITSIDQKILRALVFPEKKEQAANEETTVPLSRESIRNIVESHLAGKEYIYYHYKKDYQNDDEFFRELYAFENDAERMLITIYCHAINLISEAIKKYKIIQSIFSFDDLISKMHSAITSSRSQNLISLLQKKYKAVFIDEFQDTDRMQYEIFDGAFRRNTIMFYIGDPKQSIYAFRSADVFTYFKARSGVDNVYHMNVNYRSSEKMIEAMNDFFAPEPGFDMFQFATEDPGEGIEYIPVYSPQKNQKGKLLKGDNEEKGISILSKKNEEELLSLLVLQLHELFEGDYRISTAEGKRKIRPSDIGILVKTHNHAKKIKQRLSKSGIGAVEISQYKIFNSLQAKETLFLLEAMNEVSQNNINRALCSSFTHLTIEDFQLLDEEVLLDQFKAYQNSWKENGVYVALSQFIADFRIDVYLAANQIANGERVLSNLYQLMEILHETEYYKKLDPEEVVLWLKRQIEDKQESNEYEQRIESDEEAVKIVTVHASKGLEYNIVIAPFLEYTTSNKPERIKTYRDPETSKYYSGRYCDLDDEQKQLAETQANQEFRRLIYVAVTRAVFKCILFKSKTKRKSALRDMMTGKNLSFEVTLDSTEQDIPFSNLSGESEEQLPVTLPPIELEIPGMHWRRMSYTMLAAPSAYRIEPVTKNSEEGYDKFIFDQLDRGSITGNLLHHILENISFSNQASWQYVIANGIRRFVPWKVETYQEQLMQLLHHLMHVNLQSNTDSFSLSQINAYEIVQEMEFDFPVSTFHPQKLKELLNQESEVELNYFTELEGIMNGKIDLFFKHNEKYFILDWKSNFLGNQLADYKKDALLKAMNEHNYHLQYLIYTTAAKKFLEFKIPDFNYERDFGGVFYLFIRGIRENEVSGVYYCLPTLQQINRIESILVPKTI